MNRQLAHRPGTGARIVVMACLLPALLSLVGCASAPATRSPPAPTPPPAQEPLKNGRPSPLSDFNVGGDNIPEVLLRAVDDPYARPAPLDCKTLTTEIAALDAALGPDLDTATVAQGDFAAGLVVGAIRGLIPYSGILRLITGARARERRIAAAIAAGSIRRGYLKGLGESQHCAAPATPQHRPASPPASPTAVAPAPRG